MDNPKSSSWLPGWSVKELLQLDDAKQQSMNNTLKLDHPKLDNPDKFNPVQGSVSMNDIANKAQGSVSMNDNATKAQGSVSMNDNTTKAQGSVSMNDNTTKAQGSVSMNDNATKAQGSVSMNDNATKAQGSISMIGQGSSWLRWRSATPEIDNPLPVRQQEEIEDVDDLIPDDNGDEIEDTGPKKSSAWTFWKSQNTPKTPDPPNNNNTNTDKIISNNKSTTPDISNINTKSHTTPTSEIIKNTTKNTSIDMSVTAEISDPTNNDISSKLANNVKEKLQKTDLAKIIKDKLPSHTVNAIVHSNHSFDFDDHSDDAVLYKPHDTLRQFNQINTHKNENVIGNVIVPDWNSCLPTRRLSLIPIIHSETTSNANNNISPKMDIKSWRQYLNSLSSRLGFGLHSLTSFVESKPNSDKNQVEQEMNLLYEKTYRLYGKSLTKLPHNKRACVPNYNKQFDTSNQIFDDDVDNNEPNSISITDDAMGNLLINHKRTQHQQISRTISPSDIVSQTPQSLHKIKRILIIGVHGFFPTKMIRPIIGSPKGTSLKFANEAEKAVIRYCLENNIINQNESNDMSIQKIALEKEGKIFDRVGFFIEILKQWSKELNDADCIFVAAHSQGCVVTIILLAKLIKLGILKDPYRKRIGILAMCGINNGPFYGFDKSFFMKAYSTIEHDSLMELFELNKFDSDHSLEYKDSIQIIINVNVKICFIGSVNDQLVPLYSALASHVFHPNIYRACYIDQSAQTPPFVQKLVSLCCQLQNLGYFDNNVLKELSPILAGPMTGGGHSKIYNDGKVYDLGIKFLLDTDDIVIPPNEGRFTGYNQLQYHDIYGLKNFGLSQPENEPVHQILKLPIVNQVYIKEYNVGKIGTNPFILPWCLRGLMFNIEKNWPNSQKLISVDSGDEISRTGYDEIDDLYEKFDNWKPETKQMKDLKFRLNGLRASKL
jgi:hypothetical protein